MHKTAPAYLTAPLTTAARGFSRRGEIILADNGSAWYVSGVPDERWDNDTLNEGFSGITGSDFEAVDVSSLRLSADSGQVKAPVPVGPTGPLNNRLFLPVVEK